MPKAQRVYGNGTPEVYVLPVPIAFQTAPTSSQTNYEIGQVVYTPPHTPTAFYLYAGGGNWVQFANSSGDILNVLGTANQITATVANGVATLSLPSAITTPGSLTTTSTLTGGTGVTATTGNLTASAVGSGLLLTPTVVTAGASPQTANGRVGQVTFSGVSIASGASQTFVITNSSITGAGTVILYSWYGATAGSALSISNVTNSAGSSSIVMTNGTSATMVTSTANITFVYEVLN